MAASGKETEIKLLVDSPAHAQRLLEAAGFKVIRPRLFEANLLLDTAAGSLWARGDALRVRECGGTTILTFKGPVERDRYKSREEIETSAGDGAALLAILARLGFAPTFRYEKFRTEFACPGEQGVATLDETPIGVFVELEGEGAWIDATALRLGFSEQDYINDSYSAIFRKYCHDRQLEIGPGMVFPPTP